MALFWFILAWIVGIYLLMQSQREGAGTEGAEQRRVIRKVAIAVLVGVTLIYVASRIFR